ncbi:MAG: alcohol dehydrogenase [Bifidobacteriaceae bacterium]|jgi:hypothetical protein|nr:alcohol dehydrogenase [Bifidobacteriaceae bacterium]
MDQKSMERSGRSGRSGSPERSNSRTVTSAALKHPVKTLLTTIVSALASGVIGTGLHRSGADYNIPWGLILALALVGFSTWMARRRMGPTGVGFHLITCSAVVWWLAITMGPGGDVIVPIASKAFTTFFSMHAGYIWLFGSILIQLAIIFVPKRVIEGRSRGPRSDSERA